MKRPHRHRRASRKLTPQLRQAVEIGALLYGCVCRPDIKRRAKHHLVILHDSWCPARDTPSQAFIVNEKEKP